MKTFYYIMKGLLLIPYTVVKTMLVSLPLIILTILEGLGSNKKPWETEIWRRFKDL